MKHFGQGWGKGSSEWSEEACRMVPSSQAAARGPKAALGARPQAALGAPVFKTDRVYMWTMCSVGRSVVLTDL